MILRIIKNKHKDNWERFLKTSTKASVETLFKREGIYSIFENVKGRNMMYLACTLHPNHCFHERQSLGDIYGIAGEIQSHFWIYLLINLETL